jgi:UDP-N-acetylglucosamine diphosphorylase/glucosamine-1-phosphate N-acetyltransferase
MPRPLVIVEDAGYANLLPLTYTRPACRLRCGIETLLDKIMAAYSAPQVVVHAREHLAPVVAEELPRVSVNELKAEAALFVNGRLIAPADLASMIPLDGEDCVYRVAGEVAAARLSGSRCREVAAKLARGPLAGDWAGGVAPREINVKLVGYPWSLIGANSAQIRADFKRLNLSGRVDGTVHTSAVLDCPENIYVADGARVEAGAILAAEGGPIYLAPGAVVMAGAVVEGPVSIGHKSRIKILAKIYEGTTIGEYCKIGGEVENCIFQAFTNKQHDGFKGHSYYGEWINIGADSNNSDLKNNYSTVRVTINSREIDSGELFVGSTVGDHSKSGINSMFNTGTVVGVGCNLYGADFPPKYVPSFCWGGASGMVEHDFEKFVVTAERVMARRDRKLTPAARTMLQRVFEDSAAERREFLGRHRC